tara:strand:- start:499 stop:774 length:276 start_codon:yes stop_codon:yes gene_type:complete
MIDVSERAVLRRKLVRVANRLGVSNAELEAMTEQRDNQIAMTKRLVAVLQLVANDLVSGAFKTHIRERIRVALEAEGFSEFPPPKDSGDVS